MFKGSETMKTIDEMGEKVYSSDSDEPYSDKFDQRVKMEKLLIKRDFEKKMVKLSCCNKLYLWLRRNFVVDILFKQSDEHLDDIVNQMKCGRTNIKTGVEIGLNNISKKERKTEVEN